MEFIDITMPIRHGMAVWPGDPQVMLERASPEGEPSVTRLTLGTHSGTHIDTASHLQDLKTGPGAAKDPISHPFPAMIGPCAVVHAAASASSPGGYPLVTAGDIESALGAAVKGAHLHMTERVLISAAEPAMSYGFYLSEEAAEALVDLGHLLVGVASSSVDPPDSAALPAHHRLLGAGVAILENLVLADVATGRYELVALPLRVEGADGAPVRALLLPAHLE